MLFCQSMVPELLNFNTQKSFKPLVFSFLLPEKLELELPPIINPPSAVKLISANKSVPLPPYAFSHIFVPDAFNFIIQ